MKDEKPSEDGLEHHGVKGQKWGVRREDLGGAARAVGRDAANLNNTTKKYLSILSKNSGNFSHEEAAHNLAQNREKFVQKFAPSDGPVGGPGKGLTPKQKKLLRNAAIGVGVVGGLYVASHFANKALLSSLEKNLQAELSELEGLKGLTHPPGTPISVKKFSDMSSVSQMKTWGFSKNGYITPESFARPEFSLPKGHTFYRISTKLEQDFRIPPGTYALASIEDFNRYVVGFSKEKGGVPLHKVAFQATGEVRVPHITDVLETVREVVSAEKGKSISEEDAVWAYKAMSGGSWTGVREQSLFTALSKKGFGAIVDEMDAGVLGEKPLVVFGDQFGPKTSEPFTKATLNAAAANLTEIAWRK